MKDKTKKIKIVVVGDGGVGKTSLIKRYAEGIYVEFFLPIVFENPDVDITDGKEIYKATLVDTAGAEDYSRLRPLVYPKTDVLLLCFAIDNRKSYENITSAWLLELNHWLPNTPIILVGTKSDLEATITSPERHELKETIKASYYVECSSKAGMGVEAVFDAAATAYTNKKWSKKNKKAGCTTL